MCTYLNSFLLTVKIFWFSDLCASLGPSLEKDAFDQYKTTWLKQGRLFATLILFLSASWFLSEKVRKWLSPSTVPSWGPRLEYCVPAWGPQHRRDMEHLERVQREGLKELGLFNLEKGRLRGDLIMAFHLLKGVYKHEENQLFTRVDSDATRANGFKVK